jgi:DNA-binding winged helix-turn-helix (wHTH) protein/TolB-like protein
MRLASRECNGVYDRLVPVLRQPEMMHSTDPSIRRFGEFTVDLRAGELFHGSTRLDLQNRAFQVLALLLRSPGQLVSRQELHRALWGDHVVVEFDNNLNAAVNRLRKALRDSADAPRFIETLPGRGYRFIGTIEADATPDPPGETAPADGKSGPMPRRHPLRSALRLAAAGCIVSILSLGIFKEQTVQVAVLPFSNTSGDPTQAHIGEALAGELRAKMFGGDANVRVLVAPTASDADVFSRRHRLDADYVVMGSAARSADGLRVTALLVETRTQRRIWGDAFYCPQGDLAMIQTQLADKISRHLQRSLRTGSVL